MVIRTIGIDIGTDSSSVARFQEELTEGASLSPDDFLFLPSDMSMDDKLWSVSIAGRNRKGSIRGIKRLFGSDLADSRLVNYYASKGINITCNEDGILLVDGTSEFDLAASLLKNYLDLIPFETRSLDGIGITFPGYVQSDKVKRYIDAYQAVSSAPIIMISEAESLAAYFSIKNWAMPDQKIAIVNIGASQAWAALIYYDKDRNYQVVNEVGDLWLGGEELNQCIAELVREELNNRLDASDKERIPDLFDRVLIESESAKVNYEDQESELRFVFPFLYTGDDKVPHHIQFALHADNVISAMEEPLAKIASIAAHLLIDSNLSHYDVDRLFLAGGQAKFFPIQLLLSSPVPSGGVFGRKANLVHGKVETAYGAAIVANANLGNKNLPISLSTICGEKLPLVLRSIKYDLWPSACQFLSSYAEIQSYPVPLQVKLINASVKFGFDQVLGVLHDHGENGIDEALAEKENKKSLFDWFFKS